jgi:aminoglycoside 3-N-acetyltransferase
MKMAAKGTPFWKDALLLAAELAARNVYWHVPSVRAWVKRRRARRRPTPQIADREELKKYLRHIGVMEGALVMAHTSTSGLMLTEGPASAEKPANPVKMARQLLDDLLELVGESGTLVMPTHALDQGEPRHARGNDPAPPIVYDPLSTPCGVGLANELFWRSPGVHRSLYPYNMVAARGPLAAELLHDNLNDSKPLPHGIHSAYYRFCQKNGLVVSIGIRLGDCITLIHAAEDVRDQDFPFKDFLEERRYVVRIDGENREVVVRQQRPEYSMYCRCHRKLTRDLVGAGIMHEDTVGSVRVGWAHSREVFEYLMQRNQKHPYPLYCTWLVGNKR